MQALALPTIVLLLAVDSTARTQTQWSSAKRAAVETVDQNSSVIVDLGNRIWEFSEPAFQEHESSKLLADTLEQAGFRVQRGVAGMKTAFVAEYGRGSPAIAILAEYDALPGLSQQAAPVKEAVPRRDAGHGCGHNLFGAASTGAALAVKAAIDKHGLKGTVRLYGCPAEEGGGGKVYMVDAGLFRDVDVALHWHPATKNSAAPRTCLAVIRFRAQFNGKSAHAAGSPQEGRSAMDGVELMNVGTNYLREHIIQQARIHYVVTNGGRRPNVVPEFAESWYYIRAPKMAQAQEIFARVKKIAQGAALMSETEHEIRMVTGTYELLLNDTMAMVVDQNLRLIGPPKFTAADRQFAVDIRKTLGVTNEQDLREEAQGPLHESIEKFTVSSAIGYGSTDVGDVSWVVPTAGLRIATAAVSVPGHSWGLVACSGAPMGGRGAVAAAKVLAASTVDFLERPDLVTAAKREFDRRSQGVSYKAVLDGPPPERLEGEP